MNKTKLLSTARAQREPVVRRAAQEAHGADNVRLNKLLGPVYRPINVTFGCQMQDRVRPVLCKNGSYRSSIAHIGLFKKKARVCPGGLQCLQICGIGQLVDVDNYRIRFGKKLPDNR